MKFFTTPADPFALVLLAFTIIVAILIGTNKQSTKGEKYLALTILFFAAGTLGLISLYSLLWSIGICLVMAALCSTMYFVTGRQERQARGLLPIQDDSQLGEGLKTTLLPDADPRPLAGIRLINAKR